MNWWFSDFWDVAGPLFACSWVAWVIVSITLHELAHGWTAMSCGDDVPKHSGHMTANPFVHIPWPMAWITFALFGFTWGLMPTQPRNYNRRYDETRVALAGPGMNLMLAVFCAIVLVMVKSGRLPLTLDVSDAMTTIFFAGLQVNMVGTLFNLIPVPPLDGWHALRDLWPAYDRIWQGERGGVIGLVATWALFWYGGAAVFLFASRLSVEMVELGMRLLA